VEKAFTFPAYVPAAAATPQGGGYFSAFEGVIQ